MLGDVPDEMRRAVEIAEQNATRLSDLVDDLLDVQQLEQSSLGLRLGECDLSKLLRRVLQEFAPIAHAKGVRIALEADPGVLMVADEGRIAQICNNLLSNAVKFSPAGSEVRVLCEDRGAETRISVADEGPGIPQEKREEIFEKFFQVNGGTTHAHSGVGLGLFIVKELVELHHGTVKVRSAPGEGTVFEVTFPKGWSELDSASPSNELVSS